MLLGGYSAFQCPVRTWWDHVPGSRVDMAPTPTLQRRLDAGNRFENEVFATLFATHGADAEVITAESSNERIEQTIYAMRAGVLLVLGGQLPHDHSGARVGKPDVLLRVTPEGASPRYVPVDVKHYQQFGGALKGTRRRQSPTQFSTLDRPDILLDAPNVSGASPHRFKASMQLAHYTRMLQACGFHPGPDWLKGAVLGTSDIGSLVPGVGKLVLGWFDLSASLFATYSRSRQGSVKRSALDRYDHEFGFRVTVAGRAATWVQGDDRPVEPVWQKECGDCPYETRCGNELEGRAHRDVTFETLSVREWKALDALGVATTAELAAVDLDNSSIVETLVPHVEQNVEGVRRRLDRVVRRARLIVAGLPWEATSETIAIPSADIEIDVDMENQEDGGLVYMWGIRRREGQDESTAEYIDDFHTWQRLSIETAADLAVRYFRWMQAQVLQAEMAGRTIAFFHWSHPEISKLRTHLNDTDVTDKEFAAVEQCHVDLEQFFRTHFFAVNGTGLKSVAPALGYKWPSADAGGEHSLAVVEDAQAGDYDARRWLLAYNEADTVATAYIRDSLRAWNVERRDDC